MVLHNAVSGIGVFSLQVQRKSKILILLYVRNHKKLNTLLFFFFAFFNLNWIFTIKIVITNTQYTQKTKFVNRKNVYVSQ